MLGALVALLTGVGAAVSLVAVRKLLRSQQQLAEAFARLRNGEVIEAPVTPVLEANQVGAALADTSVRLVAQATALELQKHTLETRVLQRTRALAAQAHLLQTALDTLADSERRYRLLAEHGSDIIKVREIGGPRTYVSPACRPVLGYT